MLRTWRVFAAHPGFWGSWTVAQSPFNYSPWSVWQPGENSRTLYLLVQICLLAVWLPGQAWLCGPREMGVCSRPRGRGPRPAGAATLPCWCCLLAPNHSFFSSPGPRPGQQGGSSGDILDMGFEQQSWPTAISASDFSCFFSGIGNWYFALSVPRSFYFETGACYVTRFSRLGSNLRSSCRAGITGVHYHVSQPVISV